MKAEKSTSHKKISRDGFHVISLSLHVAT